MSAPVRDDLLHLSPEALAHAANAGIVKRAVRELAAGDRPRLTVAADGALDAHFADGTHCHWPRDVVLAQVRCSCGAPGICRHRLIAALAYREEAAAAPAATEALTAVGDADDEALQRLLSASLFALAATMRDAGLSVELRGTADGEPCATARLPAATVRYWGGASVAAARCDCVRATACEHVALGVWAFREAAATGVGTPATVRLGHEGERTAIDLAPYERLADALVRHGVAGGGDVLTQAMTVARAAGRNAAWVLGVLDDLAQWTHAYAARSTRYDAADGASLLAELSMRLSAGTRAGASASVLGLGEPAEVALDRLRLTCLGARTRRDGAQRLTSLVLADVDTGTRLLVRHAWKVAESQEGSAASAAALERRQRDSERVAPGVMLTAIATGQLLASQSARRADGSLRLARARSSQNSVLPQSADWSMLGAPLRFESVDALRRERLAHPHPDLEPRHAARRFVIFTPEVWEPPRYDPIAQCLFTVLHDAAGEPLVAQRHHERHVPDALDALAAAMSGEGTAPRHVAGMLSWQDGLPVIDVWAVAGNGPPVVPDMAGVSTGALAAVPLGTSPSQLRGSEVRGLRALAALQQRLGELLHHGLGQLPPRWLDEARALSVELEAQGWRYLAGRMLALTGDVADAAPRPADAALGRPLLRLLAMRQLHVDAAAWVERDRASQASESGE